MAKLYGEIAAKSLLTLDKSFARANGQPLDASEVYYSLEAAKAYAAGAQAYIGQKIVVVEDGVVTHYGIEDAAGNLKELGSKPVGDNSSIVVADNGTISLKGVGSLVFERDILGEDGEPTGEKEAVQYQPLMTAAGLVWVEPSKTTVEGLATLIDALAVRVKALEDNRVTKEELAAAVKVETDRAEAAEKALGERIDAIDFVDEDEMAEAIAAARELISAEIDADVKVAKDRADEAYALAESKVDATAYATDKKALEDEDAAIRAIAEGARDSINTFLNSEDIDETVNTLKEIQAEIEKMTDAAELATALASKADKSYVDEELGKKQDVIPENTYDAYGSATTAKSEAIADAEGKIATAKQEAIDAAASAAAGLYATQTRVNELETALDGRLDALEAIDHSAYTTNEVFSEYKTTVENTYATKDALAPVKQTADNAAAKVETLEDKIEEITSVGGEPNVIDYVKVNGAILEVEKDAEGKSTKTVNVIVPTKVSDLTDDTGFDARITAAQNQADKGVSDAAAAASAAAQAQNEVDALEVEVGGIQTTVTGHTTSITDYGTRIGALEQADITHGTEYNELKGIVSGHTATIATKADTTAVDAVVASAAANAAAIKTLNETTIPGVNAEIAKKADKTALSDYHTKSEIAAITGTVPADKTLVQMIADAKSEATYDDTEVRGLITAEAQRAAAAEKANADEIARVNGVLVAALENDGEGLDSIKELADWINVHGSEAAEMAEAISDNADAIAAINHVDTGILAQAKAHTNAAIAALPAATAEALGLVKYDDVTIKMNESNQLYVAKVSTDVLEQGSQTLILNGGSATA